MEATSPVLSGLIRKRAETADALRARLAAIAANMGHVDAVIGLFDPAFDLATIRPKRPRASDATKPGEMSRFVLDALREAGEPVPTAVIAARLMADRGMDEQDRTLWRVLLQTLDRGKRGAVERRFQAATSNSPATKAACACMSRPPTLWTCPFLIIAIAS